MSRRTEFNGSSAARRRARRAEVVTITSMVSKYEGSVCLPDVALYAAGHRNTRKEAVHITK